MKHPHTPGGTLSATRAQTGVRPEYCQIPDEGTPGCEGPCPGCGATIEGNDPVRGVCQARHNGPRTKPLVRLVLVDKRTGEIIV